jgi:alkylated DNA nucleotide flippase Atl1
MAIDWSGRSGVNQKQALWLGEAMAGELVRLEGGRTRAEIVDLLIAERDREPSLIVGLDFAFSLPAWFLLERGLTARALWAALDEDALTPTMRRVGLASWMNRPEPPFWTTSEAHALLAPEQRFRRTETDVRAPGFQPKSVFQLVGAGQVGRGSLYGMQALHRLAAAGFGIWPFDTAPPPVVVEIFPRLLTGAVRKNSQSERTRYLAPIRMPPELRAVAGASEDAFDAAVSALVMAAAVEELVALPEERDYTLEGKIWQPRVPVVLARTDRRGGEGALPTTVGRDQEKRRRASAKRGGETLDLDAARAFIASIPDGRWSSYGDVAAAAGAPKGAQAVGSWIMRTRGDVPHIYRVLNRDGEVSEGWKAAAPGLPPTGQHVRDKLTSEGVEIDPRSGRADQTQRWTPEDWARVNDDAAQGASATGSSQGRVRRWLGKPIGRWLGRRTGRT